ncbi:MAG: hypothetical protein KatS3mg056_1550 [Chloroflexus sp.]|jgi:hypothetical protein|nr:MAG: hypothetical protein KatS3mg056_1550 [Chloroflexus sp.]
MSVLYCTEFEHEPTTFGFQARMLSPPGTRLSFEPHRMRCVSCLDERRADGFVMLSLASNAVEASCI